MSWLLDNARLPDQTELCRLRIDNSGARVTNEAPTQEVEYWDLDGRLVLPGFAELHTHLDKTYAPVNNAAGGLWGAIEAFRTYKAQRSYEDVERAAEQALRKAISEGVTCLRSHVNAGGAEDIELVAVLHALRNRYADAIDVQLVAMGMFGTPEERFIPACIEAGADMVGGAPALQTDPHSAVCRAVALALELDVPLDLHIDEHLDAQLCTLATLADEVARVAFPRSVTASHCASLAVLPMKERAALLAQLAELQVNIVALPVCNLVLLGGDERPYLRGTAPVGELVSAGVNVCVGSDNVRDPFNPFGGYSPLNNLQISNMLERNNSEAAILASLALVTDNAHHTFAATPAPMNDLVVLDAVSVLDALCDPPNCLATFKNGRRVFARHVESTWSCGVASS